MQRLDAEGVGRQEQALLVRIPQGERERPLELSHAREPVAAIEGGNDRRLARVRRQRPAKLLAQGGGVVELGGADQGQPGFT
jgi:hypothetical protein